MADKDETDTPPITAQPPVLDTADTIRVRANATVLGIGAGETGDVDPSNDEVAALLDNGMIERVDDDER